MELLEPPIIQYLEGRRPSHSGTLRLHENFEGMDATALRFVLQKAGYLDADGRVTQKAADENMVDRCERKLLWNLDKVQEVLTSMKLHAARKSVNQELNLASSAEPKWVNQGTIATFFNVSANKVGKWLTDEGMKKGDTMTPEAFDSGIGVVTTMNAGGNKTRNILMWDLHRTIEFLLERGYELDRRSMEALKGKGKNSDVTLDTMDARAEAFVKEFMVMFRNPKERRECIRLVGKTSKGILMRAEKLMNKPGFFAKEEYRKLIK